MLSNNNDDIEHYRNDIFPQNKWYEGNWAPT